MLFVFILGIYVSRCIRTRWVFKLLTDMHEFLDLGEGFLLMVFHRCQKTQNHSVEHAENVRVDDLSRQGQHIFYAAQQIKVLDTHPMCE